jgi:DNA-binding NarL/FixJ family response regulator
MIHVLIVDEIRLTGDALAEVLAEQPDIQVIDISTDVSTALSHVQDCDLMLVNANLSQDGAYQLTQMVADYAESNPRQTRVLIVGLVESKQTMGYIHREADIDELLETVRKVHDGRAQVAPDVAAALMARVSELAGWFDEIVSGPAKTTDLTPREREVLALIGQDFTNREIADQLVVEVGTVKNHVHNILSKLEVSSRHEAALYLPLIDQADQTRESRRFAGVSS